MSLTARRIIFYLLFFIFIILAPIVVGYTAGYRWSSTQRKIVKTGALSITTIPTEAAVMLNDQTDLTHTPTLITNLLPGSYAIKITKSGYHLWGKNLTIEEGKTTFAHNVSLFKISDPEFFSPIKKSSPAVVTPESLDNFKVWYDRNLKKIVVTDNKIQKRVAELNAQSARWRKAPVPLLFAYGPHELWQYNPQNQSTTLITRLTENINTIIPIPREETILMVISSDLASPNRYTIRALELDLRDHQNNWDLAKFDGIKKTTLDEDGKILEVDGVYQGKPGKWQLQLK